MLAEDLKDLGYALIPSVFSDMELDEAKTALATLALDDPGTRNLLSVSWNRDMATSLHRQLHAAGLLPSNAVAVQCTLFRKTLECNWKVAMHQDLSIPVASRIANPILNGWSRKEGRYFVQPPPDLLSSMVAARVHLDVCAQTDGPLRVVPGSHKMGRLDHSQAAVLRSEFGEFECVTGPGDVLVMNPLLLHGSSKAERPVGSRRVLHFLFGPADRGYGLQWGIAA